VPAELVIPLLQEFGQKVRDATDPASLWAGRGRVDCHLRSAHAQRRRTGGVIVLPGRPQAFFNLTLLASRASPPNPVPEMYACLAALIKDTRGATAIEYGLIAALIGLAAVSALTSVGHSLSTTFNTVATKL
jgi:pilus assembly protein Flp/PilA